MDETDDKGKKPIKILVEHETIQFDVFLYQGCEILLNINERTGEPEHILRLNLMYEPPFRDLKYDDYEDMIRSKMMLEAKLMDNRVVILKDEMELSHDIWMIGESDDDKQEEIEEDDES